MVRGERCEWRWVVGDDGWWVSADLHLRIGGCPRDAAREHDEEDDPEGEDICDAMTPVTVAPVI